MTLFSRSNREELLYLSMTLGEVVRHILREKGQIELSNDPFLERRPITEFARRMRIFGMEKFENPTYVSSVNFYSSEAMMQRRKALGTLLIYIEQTYMAELFERLGYPELDDEDEDALKDACGTIANLIAGEFKTRMTAMGFKEAVMSFFSNYRNEAVEGVEFAYLQREKYEITFEIKNQKRLVLELTMGPVPRARARKQEGSP